MAKSIEPNQLPTPDSHNVTLRQVLMLKSPMPILNNHSKVVFLFPSASSMTIVEALMLAAFISADFSVQPDTLLSFAACYEFLEYDYDNRMITNTVEDGSICINSLNGAEGCRYTCPADSKDRFDNISINTSLSHQFSQHTKVIFVLPMALEHRKRPKCIACRTVKWKRI